MVEVCTREGAFEATHGKRGSKRPGRGWPLSEEPAFREMNP